ncbi:MAG: protease HtpX [Oligoflexia bacterium]|nr:protease HtpX [Oligoflexia bacterium]
MKWAKRIFLFMIVNVLVVLTISMVTSFLGVRPYLSAQGLDYNSLMIFCLIWGFAGALISLGLSRIMAKMMMGVRIIDPSTNDPQLRWLVQSIHRMSQQVGITTMPEVGVYDSPEVNAFATGPTKNRALVAVSTGLLNRLSQGQVEGVLGHEVAHIANGDMVTMTLIQGVVNAFVMFFARVIGFVLSQNAREENRHWVQFMTTFVVEILLSILGMFVVAYFSRMREYRADAGGADLAGRGKMIDALQGLRRTIELVDTEAQPAVATLKISGKAGGLMALLSTHPPLEERIRRLQSA